MSKRSLRKKRHEREELSLQEKRDNKNLRPITKKVESKNFSADCVNPTSKGRKALVAAKAIGKIFSAKELSEFCRESVHVQTLISLSKQGFLEKIETSPLTFRITEKGNNSDFSIKIMIEDDFIRDYNKCLTFFRKWYGNEITQEEMLKNEQYPYKFYEEYVFSLKEKYGVVPGDYRTVKGNPNNKIKRVKEGLFVHHTMEFNSANLSSNLNNIADKKENLVYCNYLEHYLLHLIIGLSKRGNMNGWGGIINYIGPTINNYFNNGVISLEWQKPAITAIEGCKQAYFNLLDELTKDSLLMDIFSHDISLFYRTSSHI